VTDPTPDQPLLRVISGRPDPDELAAVLVVLTAARRGAPDDAPRGDRVSLWTASASPARGADPTRGAGPALLPDHPVRRHGWRTSFWPH
jgi:hypothetical protein